MPLKLSKDCKRDCKIPLLATNSQALTLTMLTASGSPSLWAEQPKQDETTTRQLQLSQSENLVPSASEAPNTYYYVWVLFQNTTGLLAGTPNKDPYF